MAGWTDPTLRLDALRLSELFPKLEWQFEKELPPEALPVTLVVCGGAAMCHQIKWRGTGDVDVMLPPMTPPMREAVRTVARRNNLDPNWMNDAIQSFEPKRHGPHLTARTLYHGESLIIHAPSNDYLLGMKIRAARNEDKADIAWLMANTGLKTLSDLESVASVVSASVGQEWNPDRDQRRYMKRRVKAVRRSERRSKRRSKAQRSQPAGDKCGARNVDNSFCQNPRPPTGGVCSAGHAQW